MSRFIIFCLATLISSYNILSIEGNQDKQTDVIPMVYVEGGRFQIGLDPGRPKLKARPKDSTLWLQMPQIIGYLAPGHSHPSELPFSDRLGHLLVEYFG